MMNDGSIGFEFRVTDLPEWRSNRLPLSGASKSVLRGRHAFRRDRAGFFYDQISILFILLNVYVYLFPLIRTFKGADIIKRYLESLMPQKKPKP